MPQQVNTLSRATVRKHVRDVMKAVLKGQLKPPEDPFPWRAVVSQKLKGPNLLNWSGKQLAMVERLKKMRPQYEGLTQEPSDAVETFDKAFRKTLDLYTNRLMALQAGGGS